MITVTALCPVAFDPVPALEQPAEAGVVGVLLVEPADGRRFGLVQTDLLEALTFLGAGRQVIDERAVLSLEQYDTDLPGRVLLQLRVGSAGEEIASWACERTQLLIDARRCWAVVQDAACAWGHDLLLHDLHDLDGAWNRHFEAAQHLSVSV